MITGEGVSEKFRTRKGLSQDCPLRVLRFLIHIQNLEERWVRKNVGEAVL